MIAVYRVFQMILGVVVSLSLLYFLLSYTGSYKLTQEELQKAEILSSFADEVRTVYLTEIPTNFTHFSRYDFSSCFVEESVKDIPQIRCEDSPATASIETPVLFYPGEFVFISRDVLDYGWWTFGYAEAMPETVFVFSPDGTGASWDVMTDMVRHLPDTYGEWSIVKVEFAFCDGDYLLYPCGGRACDRGDFLSMLGSGPSGSLLPCTAAVKNSTRLVTISNSCNPQRGVCIMPPNAKGVGNAFVAGTSGPYVYKDPLDLVALAIGGSGKDRMGKTWAEKLYVYKNTILAERLPMAAKIMARRFQLIADDVQEGPVCGNVYIELAQVLATIPDTVDYDDLGKMYDLNDKLNEAKAIYGSLLDMGCERSSEGYGM